MSIFKRTINTQAVLILVLAAIILCLWIGSSAEGQHRRPNECTPTLQAWVGATPRAPHRWGIAEYKSAPTTVRDP